MLNIRKMNTVDLDAVAKAHSVIFPRQTNSLEWIKCNFEAYPRNGFERPDLKKKIREISKRKKKLEDRLAA